MRLILGSSSPRRQQMLRDLGIPYSVITADIDESNKQNEAPMAFAKRMAKEKAQAVMEKLSDNNYAILTADTIVVRNSKILGKPQDEKDAVKMLKSLSGKEHKVITAWCWLVKSRTHVKIFISHSITKVNFSKRSDAFWKWYVSTGEPMDKAGAYAAQGIGMSFIKSVRGSYSNVVGLPLSEVIESFEMKFKIKLHETITN